MFSRREFVKGCSLIALAPSAPRFLADTARAATADPQGRVLVVIQLDGGNDGLNTVVPYGDDGYHRNRSKLLLQSQELIKLNDHVGLHPSLRELGGLWDDGRLAIAQGVGYPNPSKSHDVSMAIWQTCRFDPAEQKSYGWLGRAFDSAPSAPNQAAAATLLGDSGPPVALRGRRSAATAIDRLDEFNIADDMRRAAPAAVSKGDDLSGFLTRTTLDAYATADRLAELAQGGESSSPYPATRLAERLKTASRLIKAGMGSRVYYAVQSGYDTHAGQAPTHARLLRELSGAIGAFLEDLAAAKLVDRVVVMAFSEFGRRVAENASFGTDHGTAGPVLIAGAPVRGGLLGVAPSLDGLAVGEDPESTLDFRRIYASLLTDWLGLDATESLGGEFEPAKLLS